MTIELITGTPGAGKTTYAVAERVAVECVRELVTDEGNKYSRRVLTAGVRGLVLDHEKLPHKLTGERVTDADVDFWNQMASGDTPLFQRLAGDDPIPEVIDASGNTRPLLPLVQNWWLWCKPGDLIVVDEAQFLAPRGSLGKKAPYWIQALEIHRHYGVDFIIITQHPQLIDTTIRNLVGLHRHVRAVMGSPVCMLYSWDHASNPERTAMATKKAWVRRAKHYALFHSSVAHIKPPSTGRFGLVAAFALLAVFGVGIKNFFAKFEPDQVAQAKPEHSASGLVPASLEPAASAASAPSESSPPVPVITGCIAFQGGRGYCVDQNGGRVDMPPDVVAWNAQNMGGFIKYNMAPTASASPVQPAQPPVMAQPAPVSGFADPSPRPNPVRPLAGGLWSAGGV